MTSRNAGSAPWSARATRARPTTASAPAPTSAAGNPDEQRPRDDEHAERDAHPEHRGAAGGDRRREPVDPGRLVVPYRPVEHAAEVERPADVRVGALVGRPRGLDQAGRPQDSES